jgi:hypothetical protein
MIQLLDIQGTAKELVLLGPFERQVGQSLQALNGEIGGLASGEDRLNDVGAETGERQKSADLCWIEVFISGETFQRNDLPGNQLLHPFIRSRDDADEMLVSAWRVRMGCEHDLRLDAAALDQQGVAHMEDRAEMGAGAQSKELEESIRRQHDLKVTGMEDDAVNERDERNIWLRRLLGALLPIGQCVRRRQVR